MPLKEAAISYNQQLLPKAVKYRPRRFGFLRNCSSLLRALAENKKRESPGAAPASIEWEASSANTRGHASKSPKLHTYCPEMFSVTLASRFLSMR